MNRIGNILLTLFSLYLGLFIVDIFLKNYSYRNVSIDKRTKSIRNKVNINKIKKAAELRRIGYLPVVNPKRSRNNPLNKIDSWYPVGGLPNAKTYLSCDEGYGVMTYISDRFGFRNKDKKWENILEKKINIALGDSFIHGYCVPNENTIPYLMEKKSNETFLNLGMGNNTSYDYIATLKYLIEPLIKAKVDINTVNLFFYINDNNLVRKDLELKLEENFNIFEIDAKNISNLKMNSKYYDQQFKAILNVLNKNKMKKLPKFMDEIRPFLSSSKQVILLKNIRKFLVDNFSKNNYKNKIKDYSTNSPSSKAIKYLKNVCTGTCIPRIIYIPNSTLWDPDPESLNYLKHLRITSKQNEIELIDLSNVIKIESKEDYSPAGGHFSKEGYLKSANYLIDLIKPNE